MLEEAVVRWAWSAAYWSERMNNIWLLKDFWLKKVKGKWESVTSGGFESGFNTVNCQIVQCHTWLGEGTNYATS